MTRRNESSVLTSLSELRRIEARRVEEEEERARQQVERRREAARQREAAEREAARQRQAAQQERARAEREQQEAAAREERLRQLEAERLQRVEAELALERARIVSAPVDVARGRSPHLTALSALLVLGLLAGGGLLWVLHKRSGQLDRYTMQMAELDRESRAVQQRMGTQVDLREAKIERLQRELSALQARHSAAAAAPPAPPVAAKKPPRRGGKAGKRGAKKGAAGKKPVAVPLRCLNSADPIGCINDGRRDR